MSGKFKLIRMWICYELFRVYALLASLSIGFGFLVLPPVIDRMLDLYQVSYAGVSILLSALMWSHAAVQIPAGILSDRMGLRRSLLISYALIAGGSILSAIHPTLGLAVCGRVVAGLGSGLDSLPP